MSGFDPRRSAAAGVGWCVALAMGGAWTWWLQREPTGDDTLARIAGYGLIALTALMAAALVARAWEPVQRALMQRTADELAPLALPGTHEGAALAEAVNRVLAHQREHAEHHKRMVAEASHQIRTPLAALRTQLQSATPASIAQQLPGMLRAIDRATNVANEFLSRMKIEQRLRGPSEAVVLRLDDVAREAALEFSPLITEKRLAFELDALPVAVRADAWMLGELVRNLLANAIGHTPTSERLGIVVRQAVGAPEMVVWDSGAGISDAVRERVFEPFAAATLGTGVGLGLSICKQLAEAMGAEVHLFNRSDGQRVIGVDAVVRWDLAIQGDSR
jgi:signal transduction histidine kinase